MDLASYIVSTEKTYYNLEYANTKENDRTFLVCKIESDLAGFSASGWSP